MMERFGEKLRTFFARFGHTCDSCGVEVFNYPKERLCADCEKALIRNCEHVCPKCGRKTRASGVCLACKQNLPNFTVGFSPFTYEGLTASLINRLKNGDRYLSNFFGEEMANYLRSKIQTKDLLVTCVPLTKEKMVARGYNQSEELAKVVADKLGLECDFDVLHKTRERIQQKDLSGKERAENVSGAYRVHKRKAVKGRDILLIDDIMTTGATGSECARVLKNAGAREVIFLTASSLKERL